MSVIYSGYSDKMPVSDFYESPVHLESEIKAGTVIGTYLDK